MLHSQKAVLERMDPFNADRGRERCENLDEACDLMWWTASTPGIAVCQSVAVKVT